MYYTITYSNGDIHQFTLMQRTTRYIYSAHNPSQGDEQFNWQGLGTLSRAKVAARIMDAVKYGHEVTYTAD